MLVGHVQKIPGVLGFKGQPLGRVGVSTSGGGDELGLGSAEQGFAGGAGDLDEGATGGGLARHSQKIESYSST